MSEEAKPGPGATAADVSRPAISRGMAAWIVLDCSILAFVVTNVLPKYGEVFREMDMRSDLPPLTALFIGASDLLQGPRAVLAYVPALWFTAYWFWDRDRRRNASGWAPEEVALVRARDRRTRRIVWLLALPVSLIVFGAIVVAMFLPLGTECTMIAPGPSSTPPPSSTP